MKSVMNKIKELRVVPVVKVDSVDEARALASALVNGNLPVAEITLRTSAGIPAIKAISNEFPDMLVGAGTVLNLKQAVEAVKAGAKFIVSPGLSVDVAEYCEENGIVYLPGCVTPTEIMTALSLGITTVKFFPASVYGGLKAIKALSAPFADVTFMPTGGVNEDNLSEFLSFGKIVACGGSWMVEGKLIKDGRFDEIERLAKRAREIALESKNN